MKSDAALSLDVQSRHFSPFEFLTGKAVRRSVELAVIDLVESSFSSLLPLAGQMQLSRGAIPIGET